MGGLPSLLQPGVVSLGGRLEQHRPYTVILTPSTVGLGWAVMPLGCLGWSRGWTACCELRPSDF